MSLTVKVLFEGGVSAWVQYFVALFAPQAAFVVDLAINIHTLSNVRSLVARGT